MSACVWSRRCYLEVSVHLHGILRDHLPPEAKGRAAIRLADGATLADLLTHLGVKRRVIIALNGDQEPDKTHILQDGDQVSIYTIIGGG
jgi:thiamine biosynthesis protein ThiS